jgi:AraC-like DNA-binding protein
MASILQPLSNPNRLKYLVNSEQDLLWGMTVSTVGYQHIPPGSAYPTPNHPDRYLFSTDKGRILDEYHLVYLSRGSGSIRTKSVPVRKLSEGDMFLLFPGEWHTYKPDTKTGWDEHWIGFQGADMDNKVRNNLFQRSNPVFKVGINDEIARLFNQAVTIALEQKTGFQQQLAGIATHLLALTYSLDKNRLHEDTQFSDQVNKAKIMMLERLFDGVKPEDIADELNMSYSWFRRVFRDYTGLAPYQYIQELKIYRTKEILSNTNASIKQIALSLGFENPEYFFTAFRKKTGMTPTQYRNRSQGLEMD